MKIMVFLAVISITLFSACSQSDSAAPETPSTQQQAASIPATTPAAPSTTVTSTTPTTTSDSTAAFNLPYVELFSVQPVNTTMDYPAVLKWEVKNATSVIIEPNVGIVQATGSHEFTTPDETTTYKLTAENARGSIIATTTLTISFDLPGRDTPVVKEFTASPYVIKKGESATLKWKTQAASAVTLDGQTVNADGNMQVTPDETSTYTILATSTDGTQYQTVTVNVK